MQGSENLIIFILQWCLRYLKAEESWQWCLQRMGAQQWSPQELCAPHWTFPRLFVSAGVLSHLLALHVNVCHAAGAGACTQAGWGHNFGTSQDSHQNYFLKRPHHSHSDNFIFIFFFSFWFSRSVVMSVFVSNNFIISAADFKWEHKGIFWLFDQLLVPNACKVIPNNSFHVGDIFNVSKNMNLMVYFTKIFFLTFPESAGLLQSLQEKLCL